MKSKYVCVVTLEKTGQEIQIMNRKGTPYFGSIQMAELQAKRHIHEHDQRVNYTLGLARARIYRVWHSETRGEVLSLVSTTIC